MLVQGKRGGEKGRALGVWKGSGEGVVSKEMWRGGRGGVAGLSTIDEAPLMRLLPIIEDLNVFYILPKV